MAIITKTMFSELQFGNRIDGELYNPKLKISYILLQNTGIELKKLRETCMIKSGTTPIDRDDDLKHGPILFKTTDIRNAVLTPFLDYYHISEKIHNRMSSTKLVENDILLNIVGATLDVIGRTGITLNNFDEANITQAMVFLRIKKSLQSGYLFAFLNTRFAQDQIKRFARPTGQFNLNLNEVGQIQIPIFKESIQQEIHALIVKSGLLGNQSKTLYQQATALLEQELGLDNSDLDSLPNKYVSSFNSVIAGKRLDPEYFNPRARTIVERIRSLEHTTVAKQFHVRNGFPWNSKKFLEDNSGEPVIRIRDVKPTYIDNKKLTSIEKKYADSIGFPKAKAGDVVIGMDGLRYFYASILEDDCMVNQRVCHIYAKENAKVSSEYVTFIINSKIGQAQIMRDMTIATTVGHITNVNVAKLIIPIVSDKFQKEITDLVRKSIDADKQSKQLLQEAKNRVEQLIEIAASKQE